MSEVSKIAIAIYAQDWSTFTEQYPASESFETVYGWICGILHSEDERQLVLAHHYFNRAEPSPQVRFVTCIPKSCILERRDFPLGDTA